MSDKAYDLVVIGGGPGGYVAAIRAAQLGLGVACVDKRGTLGGTCLNVGCIPSKALLHSSELYEEAGHGMAAHGVMASRVGLDLEAMMARKDRVVGDLVKGVAHLLKKNRVAVVRGTARLTGAGQVAVADDGGTDTIEARNILIATGSDHAELPGVEIDERRIVSSAGALSLAEVPKRLVVIGAGYIGLELGSVWRRLGAEVSVVEFLERIVPGMDAEIAKQLQRTLTKQGMSFRLGTKVTAASKTKAGVSLSLEPVKGGRAETVKADVALVSVGRRPYTQGLGLDEVGVQLDNMGYVRVDGRFQTTAEGIFAIGDVIGGAMLAHKAEDEGSACAEILAGQAGHVNYGAIPAVVYTRPEVAAVGQTEDELKAAGVAYKVGKFPFTANSRARVTGETEGFVKIIADAASDRVLGVHILASDAGTMIHEASLAMEFGASAEDIARSCHAHPTLNEAVKEAALAVDGRAIHI